MWGDGGAGLAFGVRLGFGVVVGFAFGLGAIALGLVDLAVRGFAVLGVAALRLMDFLDVFRFAMSPPGVWLVVRVCVAVGHASGGVRRGGWTSDRITCARLTPERWQIGARRAPDGLQTKAARGRVE
jgi:hypothetical protein